MNYFDLPNHARGADAASSPSSPSEGLGDYYGSIAGLFGSSWYTDPTVLGFIANALPLGVSTVLDLCCGPGLVATQVLQRHQLKRYDMVDISSSICNSLRERFSDQPEVRAFCGDWTKPIVARGGYDLIIVKNALHLLSSLTEKLEALHRIAKPNTRIILVETVSPNAAANAFIKNLFAVSGLDQFKSHYFTDHSLRERLREALLSPLEVQYFDQEIDLLEWLERKNVSELRKRLALDFVARAANQDTLRRSMKIGPNGAGGFKMLRRQFGAVLMAR